MKTVLKITFAIFLSTITLNSFSQTTRTWDGGGGANTEWSTANNWSGNTVPGNNDIASFTSTASVLITGNTNVGKLQVSNNSTVTLKSSGGDRTITVKTASNDALTISSDSKLIIVGNNSGNRSMTLTTDNDAGLEANISGILKVASESGNNGIFTKGGSNAVIKFNSGSTYNHNVDGENIPSATWNTNSLCTITGIITNDPGGLDGQTFYNLTYNSTAQTGGENIDQGFTVQNDFKILSTNTGSLKLANSGSTPRTITTKNFEMASGQFFLSSNTAIGTLNVSGNFTHSGGLISENDAGSGSIIFNGTTPQVFTSGGTVTETINYTVNNNAILQMAAENTVVNGASFTLSSGGTLDIKSANGITNSATGTGASAGNIRTTTRTFNTGANYIYSGDNQSVGNGLTGALNLTLSGTGTKTFASATLAINAILTVADGITMIIPNNGDYSAGRLFFGSNEQLNSYWAGTNASVPFTGSTSPYTYYLAPSNFKAYKSAVFGTSTTGILLVGPAALPVTLTSFTAKPTSTNTVALNWATSSEIVNKGFRIERQAGGVNGKFESLGFVASKAIGGNSQTALYYNFIDASPRSGATAYYRLAQEDLDGKTTFSEVRVVKLNGETVSMVFPNPSNGAVNISRTANGKKMNVQVIDMAGRMIQQFTNITDSNFKLNINKSGIYNIKMSYPETGEQSVQRIVIER